MTDFYPPLRSQNFPFPLLSWFLDAYLHQDWDISYASDIDALDGFRNDFEHPDRIGAELLSELDGAFAIPEPQLIHIMQPLSGYYFGADAHAWLEKLRAHLLTQMGKSGA